MAPFRYELPPRVDPYRSPYTVTLANLMGAGDHARAQAERQSGQAVANAATDIGQTVGATLNNIVKLNLDAPRREHEAIALRQAKEGEADDKAARDAFQQSKGDPEAALKLLEEGGNYTVAMKLRSTLHEQRLKGLDEVNKQLDSTGKRLGMATQLLQGVPSSPDPAGAYANVLPQVREIVGPGLAGYLPDTYDPKIVSTALTWGMKANEAVNFRRQAGRDAMEGLQTAVTRTELADKLTKSTATWAQTIDSQEGWDEMLTTVKSLGGDVADGVLKQFASTYSPEAVQSAQKLLGKTPPGFQRENVIATVDGKTRVLEAGYDTTKNQWFAPGSTTPLTNVRKFERDPATGNVNAPELAKAVLENPDIFQDLTDSAKTAIWPALNAAGFTRPAQRDTGSSRAVAERWKLNALHKVEENLGYQLITPEQATAQRAEIETSFQAQVGGAAPTAPRPTDAPKPGPPPKNPPAGAVPDSIKQLLGSQKAGKYTLTDGSVWIKDASGAIRKGS